MNQQAIKEVEKIELIRPELNIEKWIVFTTSTFRGKSKEVARDVILPDGSKAVRKVVVGRINETEVGVLRIADLKIYCALVKLWEKAGQPREGNVSFALHEIAKTLGWTWGGWAHQEIKKVLFRLANIPIIWYDSFYWKDRDVTERLISNFHILEDLRIYEREEGGQLSLALSSFRFDNRLLENLLNNYTKPLYLDTILSFKKEISILLYRHLDLIMADKDYYERRSKLLLEEDLHLSESYVYPSKRKQILEPVLQELKGCRLSTGVLSSAEFRKTTDGKDYKVIFRKTTKVPELSQENSDDIRYSKMLTPEKQELFSLLRDRKIGTKSALAMVKTYPERIKEKVKILDWLRQNSGEKIQSPTGFLRRMIEEDWQPPPGFISQAEQEKRTKQAEIRQQEFQYQEEASHSEELLAEQARQQCQAASPWKSLWEKITDILAQRLSHQSFAMWIQPLFIAEVQETTVVIDCPNQFAQRWVEESYRLLIEDAVATVCGDGKRVIFVYTEE